MSEQLIDMSPMQSVLHSFSPPCNARNRVKEDERFPRLKRHISFRVFIYLINLAYCKIQFQDLVHKLSNKKEDNPCFLSKRC